VWIALLALLGMWPAAGSTLDVRWVTVADGLPVDHTTSVTQDADGWILASTLGGVVRWDGVRARRLPGVDPGEVRRMDPSPSGGVVLWTISGEVYEVRGERVQAVLGPEGEPLRARDAVYDTQGRLLAPRRDGLWRRERGAWTRLDVADLSVRTVHRGIGPDLILGTDSGWHTWREGQSPERIAEPAGRPHRAAVAGDGAIWLLDNHPAQVRRVHQGRVRTHFSPGWQGARDLLTRGSTAWVAAPSHLAALRPDGHVQLWDRSDDHKVSGTLHMDREGSLWAGSFVGLAQLPDPELLRWTLRDGLTTEHLRYVARHHGQVWLSGWSGLEVLDPATDTLTFRDQHVGKGRLCHDADGWMWTVAEAPDRSQHLLAVSPQGVETTWPGVGGTNFRHGCARAPDGDLWMAVGQRLLRVRGDAPPRDLGPLPQDLGMNQDKSLVHTRDGTLWLAAHTTACHTSARQARSGQATWTCEPLPARRTHTDLVEAAPGVLWVAALDTGLLERRPDGWVRIAGAERLGSTHVMSLVPALDGGTWIVGHGVLARAVPGPDGPRMLESLHDRLGRHLAGAHDLTEAPDGALWVVGGAGLAHVPATSRRLDLAPPRMRPLRAQVDGIELPGPQLTFSSPDDVLEVELRAASYRAPRLLRYRYRLDAGAWSEPTRTSSVLFESLSPGIHHLQAVASLDGVRWSDEPAYLQITVPAPWWRRPGTWAIAGALVLLIGVLIHRIRLATALRVARMRERVAMDLHDELGAGLAAIALRADVLGLSVEGQAHEVASGIGSDAEDLGARVSGLVWSLREESATLEGLATFLLGRAQALFAHLPPRSVRITTPDPLPTVAIDVDVLRTVQRIALEALHNAAAHGDPEHVRVDLAPAGRGWWRLLVEDDGVGFDPEQPVDRPEGGLGLPGMRRRASQSGVRLRIDSSPGEGTRIELRFRPSRDPWGWLRSVWRWR